VDPAHALRSTTELWLVVGLALIGVSAGIGGVSRLLIYGLSVGLVILVLIVPTSAIAIPPSSSSRYLSLLIIIGLAGSTIGRLYFGQDANALALFVPLTIYVAVAAKPPKLTAGSVEWLLTSMRLATLVFSVVGGLIGLGVAVPLVAPGQFLHQNSFLMVPGLLVSIFQRRLMSTAIILAGAIAIFISYPALTFVLVASTVLIILSFHVFGGRVQLAALMLSIATIVVALSANTSIEALRTGYFRAVGKNDNSHTREVLFKIGLHELQEHPFLGTMFINNISVPAPPEIIGNIAAVPLHDDYLQIAVGGGVAYAVAFFGAAFWLVARGHGRNRISRCSTPQALLAMSAYSCCTAMFVICVANPILVATSGSWVLAIMLSIGHLANGAARSGES
jgi:hypothetical protein